MKKLIAAAVAAAIIVPATAMAGSTLYGKIHMSTAYVTNDEQTAGVSEYSELTLNSHASRIGVKGSEDLGNGLKVGYLMEWGVGMDGNKAADLAGGNMRNRYVTLGGGFGTIILGRLDTPMKSLGRKIDLFGERVADLRQLTKAGAAIDGRVNNVIAYASPSMGGFVGTFAYVTGLDSASQETNNADAISMTGIYSNGPILVGAGYTQISEGVFGTTDDEKDFRLAGSFKMGAAKIVGGWTGIDNGLGAKKNDYDVWTIGGAFDFGSNTVKAQYSDKSVGVSGSKDDATVWGLGFEHKMSKRTMVYVDYGQLNNGKGSNIALMSSSAGYTVPAGGNDSTPTSFALGIVHNF